MKASSPPSAFLRDFRSRFAGFRRRQHSGGRLPKADHPPNRWNPRSNEPPHNFAHSLFTPVAARSTAPRRTRPHCPQVRTHFRIDGGTLSARTCWHAFRNGGICHATTSFHVKDHLVSFYVSRDLN